MELSAFALPGLSTVAVLFQAATAAQAVGKAREKFKVPVPNTTGVNEDFDRYFRAHQNCLEFLPMIICLIWLNAVFGSTLPFGIGAFMPTVAAVFGFAYAFFRTQYVKGYYRSVKERTPGFYRATFCIRLLFYMALLSLLWNVARSFGVTL
eukprot:TRINITY_DN31219_c0_g1_i1.p1 TRINITY_DN31219_c0_g1~~TRINITY_DN31219_c0_g1_i1.p1  ORF type:complete len:151 (-),score=8.48 TRINITY_DN31219_c0_g1_i1:214-666(-)